VKNTLMAVMMAFLAIFSTSAELSAQEPVVLSYKRVAADVVSFQGNPGIEYIVQTSVNLIDWHGIALLHGTGNGFQSYTNFPNQEHLFYRVVITNDSPDGVVIVSLDSSTPLPALIPISRWQSTYDVALGVWDIRSHRTDSVIRKLDFVLNTTGGSGASLFEAIGLFRGSTLIAYAFVLSNDVMTSSVTFDNLEIPIPAEQTIALTLCADISPDLGGLFEGVTANAVLVASGSALGMSNNPVVTDSHYGRTLSVNSTTVSGNMMTFTSLGLLLGNLGAYDSITTVYDPWGYMKNIHELHFTFTANNYGGNGDLYFSKDINEFLRITNSIPSTVSSNLVLSVGTSTVASTENAYIIPAGGSCTFSIYGNIVSTNITTPSSGVLGITGIRFGNSPDNLTTYTYDRDLQRLSLFLRF